MAAKRGRSGGRPFVEEDGIVFSTDVSDDTPPAPGLRGEAVEGDLRGTHGNPKGSYVDDEAIGGSSRKTRR